MTKARAAGVLGALILCGLLFLSNLAVAEKDTYFAQLQGAFTQGCVEMAPGINAPRTDEEAAVFFHSCLAVVHALRPLSVNDTGDDLFQGIFRNLSLIVAGSTCEQCVHSVQDFEAALIANTTGPGFVPSDLVIALRLGCATRFPDPDKANQCVQILDGLIPGAVDALLSDHPPLIACRELNLCAVEPRPTH